MDVYVVEQREKRYEFSRLFQCWNDRSLVMDIFKTHFYRANVRFLTFVGLWPYNDGRRQRIQQIFFHISVITVMISQIIKLFEIWGDMDIMIECITPIGVELIGLMKYVNSIVNQEKMKRLLDQMKSDWSKMKNVDEIEILTRYAEQGRKLTIFYSAYLIGSMCLYFIVPLIPKILDVIAPHNESRPPTYLYPTQHYVDPEEYFYLILVHSYTGSTMAVMTLVAADAMHATYVHHVCGILAVVGNRFENLAKNSPINIDTNPPKKDDECYWQLVGFIDQHFAAVEFANLIESAYSTAYLLQVGTGVVLLSMTLVQILVKLGEYEEMIRIAQLSLAQLSHLLFNSWPGQKLIDQTVSFRDSIYCSEWYSFSIRTRKLLRIVMLRSLIPSKITAGKLYDMSMESYGKVVQTSVSYFTVFASLR